MDLPLSRRTAWDLGANRLAGAAEAARARGERLLDLAESNPTRCGLAWPDAALRDLLAAPGLATYAPEPRGLPGAREAVCRYLGARGAAIEPERVLLASSTSEAYAALFTVLCDPGDEVLVPAPSYPLLDVLADLSGVALRRYPLDWDGAWHLDLPALEALAGPRTRALVVVTPGNPTGAVLDLAELAALEALCAERGLALVGDEVFADAAPGPLPSVASRRACVAVHLSGLSKVCGLPQLKLAWSAVAGPEPEAARLLARLEIVADTFLSAATPVQRALPALLDRRETFLAPLRARLAANRATLARAAAEPGALFQAVSGQAGWSAVLRIGQTVEEEGLCLDLLDDGVVVHPGFFYDFDRPGHLVVSLLPEPAAFAEGVARIAGALGGR